MAVSALLPITRLPRGGVPATALVCGDPARAERIAGRLEGARQVSRNREYHGYVGRYGGTEVAVLSHGVGAAGAAVAFEELIQAGAERIIRVGTCGSFVDDVAEGEYLIPTAAAREDGLTDRLVPMGLPAVADVALGEALAASARVAGARFRRGIVLSHDAFYSGALPSPQALYAACGVLGVEMECSALFVVAALRGARAAAILAVDGYPLRRRDDAAEYDPHRQVVRDAAERQIGIALEAAVH